jgi:hypothetical protein
MITCACCARASGTTPSFCSSRRAIAPHCDELRGRADWPTVTERGLGRAQGPGRGAGLCCAGAPLSGGAAARAGCRRPAPGSPRKFGRARGVPRPPPARRAAGPRGAASLGAGCRLPDVSRGGARSPIPGKSGTGASPDSRPRQIGAGSPGPGPNRGPGPGPGPSPGPGT